MSIRQQKQVLQLVLPEEKAFYFYNALDSPTGQRASGLEEFLEKLKSSDETAVAFHSSRGDFEKWLTLLQDKVLVNQFATIREEKLPPAETKKELIRIVSKRIVRLRNPSAWDRMIDSLKGWLRALKN
jgi:hypothetical protein